MSFIDNMLGRMHIGGDEDIDDENEDMNDDYDDIDDGPTSRRSGRRASRRAEEEEEDDFTPQPSRARGQRASRSVSDDQGQDTEARRTAPTARDGRGSSNMQVRIIKPSSFDQAKLITDTLLSHRTVLLNMEGLDVNTAQRIVDFASGSCYALHGNFMKISHFIIVITPEDVSISGDISVEGEAAQGLGAMNAAAAAAAQGQNARPQDTGFYTQPNPFTQGLQGAGPMNNYQN